MRIIHTSNNEYIRPFSPIDLPDFSVWTGVNGAGKTQLMKAITTGHVTIEGISPQDIKYYNYKDFLVSNSATLNGQQIDSLRNTAWQQFQGAPNSFNVRAILQQLHNQNFIVNIDGKKVDLIAKYLPKDISIWEAHAEPGLVPEKLRVPIREFVQQVKAQVFSSPNFKKISHNSGIKKAIKKTKKDLHLLSEEKFSQYFTPSHGSNDHLATSLGVVFSRYKVAQYNWVHDKFDASNGAIDGASLYLQFENENEKPWDVINEILRDINRYSGDISVFNFQITHPDEQRLTRHSYHQYSFNPQLMDKNEEAVRAFNLLSSGEQVLLALAISVYEAKDDFIFPDLLLLDEIDASLHPSMAKALIKTLESVFAKRGTKVILATHSPSTIALAPDESVFVVNKGPVINKIEKKDNKEALELLTEGFATLENGISFFNQISQSNISIVSEGRNTVFIEKAMEHFGIVDVSIVKGIEEKTGKDSLVQYFRLIENMDVNRSVLFIWDCDVKGDLKIVENNNTYTLVLPENIDNSLASRGIENMFPEHLFNEFIRITKLPGQESEIRTFDKNYKKRFEEHVLINGTKDDFALFHVIVSKLDAIRKQRCDKDSVKVTEKSVIEVGEAVK